MGGDGDKGAAVDVVLSALSGLLMELLNRSSVYGLAFLLCPALMDGWMGAIIFMVVSHIILVRYTLNFRFR